MKNKSGTDETGKRVWNWAQVKEAFTDPATLFGFLNVFLVSIPNGGTTTFGTLINESFGFTPLQTIIYGIPSLVVSMLYFLVIGLAISRWAGLRVRFFLN